MKSIVISLSVSLLITATNSHATVQSWTPFSVVESTTDAWIQRNGLDDVVGIPFDYQVDDHFAQAGIFPGLYAKGRADFGQTGAYAIATGQPVNNGAYAETSWSDAFTLSGGVGSGFLDVKVKVDGHFSGTETNVVYYLFASNSPITHEGILGFRDDGVHTPPDDSTDVMRGFGLGAFTLTRLTPEELAWVEANPLVNGSNIYSAQIPFTYDVPLYIASYLGVEALGDGVADFYGTAHFGITAPEGASIASTSGTVYQSVAAVVPLPSAIWLFGSSVLGLGILSSRRKLETAAI